MIAEKTYCGRRDDNDSAFSMPQNAATFSRKSTLPRCLFLLLPSASSFPPPPPRYNASLMSAYIWGNGLKRLPLSKRVRTFWLAAKSAYVKRGAAHLVFLVPCHLQDLEEQRTPNNQMLPLSGGRYTLHACCKQGHHTNTSVQLGFLTGPPPPSSWLIDRPVFNPFMKQGKAKPPWPK